MSFYKKNKWLLPSLAFSLLLVVARIIKTQELTFAFLVWNLFLAILPLYFSWKARNSVSKHVFITWLLLWLLFFPNAMYIVTDIFHLKQRQGIPLWFDLVVLSSAAINGMVYGMLSLHNIEVRLRQMISKRLTELMTVLAFLLCGYGIYLGRYLRWNSWNIITSPFRLLCDMIHHVIHPFENQSIWMVTIVFGVWMYLMYGFVKRVKKNY